MSVFSFQLSSFIHSSFFPYFFNTFTFLTYFSCQVITTAWRNSLHFHPNVEGLVFFSSVVKKKKVGKKTRESFVAFLSLWRWNTWNKHERQLLIWTITCDIFTSIYAHTDTSAFIVMQLLGFVHSYTEMSPIGRMTVNWFLTYSNCK